MRWSVIIAMLPLIAAPAIAVECPEGEVVTGPAGVTDGDTLLFALQDQTLIERLELPTNVLHIRIQGLAAPEDGRNVEPGGPEATAAMVELVIGQVVACTLDGTSTWGRCVAICRVGDQDVAEALVRRGLARDCPAFSHGRYRDAERAAADQGVLIREIYDLPGYCGAG